MMLYEKIFQTLDFFKVRYLVVGGVAAVLHGVPRFTKDLDLLVDMDRENLEKLIRAMNKIEYFPRVPVKPEEFADPSKRQDWIRNKNMKAFTFVQNTPPFEQVDIVLESPVSFEKAYEKRHKRIMNEVSIWLVDVKDLIKMKSSAGRAQDKKDISDLKELHHIQ